MFVAGGPLLFEIWFPTPKLSEKVNEGKVLGAVAFVAVQVSEGHMVRQGRRKRVFPVETGDGRILRSRRRFRCNRNRKGRGRIETGELAPPEEVEVVLFTPFMVEPEHIHIAVGRERVRDSFGQRVIGSRI